MFSRLMSINNHLYWLITTYTGPPNNQTDMERIKPIQEWLERQNTSK